MISYHRLRGIIWLNLFLFIIPYHHQLIPVIILILLLFYQKSRPTTQKKFQRSSDKKTILGLTVFCFFFSPLAPGTSVISPLFLSQKYLPMRQLFLINWDCCLMLALHVKNYYSNGKIWRLCWFKNISYSGLLYWKGSKHIFLCCNLQWEISVTRKIWIWKIYAQACFVKFFLQDFFLFHFSTCPSLNYRVPFF